MKKSGILIGLVAVLLLAGCTKNTAPAVSSGSLTNSETPVVEPAENPTENGEPFVEGAVVYSLSCGYLSSKFVPEPYYLYLVTNEEELYYAEAYLGMKAPVNAGEIYGFNYDLADAFQKMKEDYPISDYNYLLEYLEYTQGGYYHHSDGLVYEEDRIRFHYDKDVSPEGEIGTDVMGGDFMMAAVPKTFFEGKNVTNTVRYGIPPTEEDGNSSFRNEAEDFLTK